MSFLRATTIATAAVALLLLAVVARGEVLSAQSDPLRVRARPVLAGETLQIIVASGHHGERGVEDVGLARVWLADGEHTTRLRALGCRGLLVGAIDVPADQPAGVVRLQVEVRTRGEVRTTTLAARIVAVDVDRGERVEHQRPSLDEIKYSLQRRHRPALQGQRWEQRSRGDGFELRQRQDNRRPERQRQASAACELVRP